MPEFFTREQYEEAAHFIQERTSHRPTAGLILGSGLGSVAEELEEPDVLPYEQIPHFPAATVMGHPGRLLIGRLAGRELMVMQGRAHYYEGYSIYQVVFPIRTMQVMGINTLIITNAAGGLNPDFELGDLMLIKDHINLVGMAGINPLRGPNDPTLGPRFPDMSQAYDPALRALAHKVASELSLELREGVYIMLAGPTFETPADLRFLRTIGVDAVGMSTVPEVITAHHGGMRVLGISSITNIALAHESSHKVSHLEVLEAGKAIAPKLAALIKGILARLEEV